MSLFVPLLLFHPPCTLLGELFWVCHGREQVRVAAKNRFDTQSRLSLAQDMATTIKREKNGQWIPL